MTKALNATTISTSGLDITIACDDHDTKDEIFDFLERLSAQSAGAPPTAREPTDEMIEAGARGIVEDVANHDGGPSFDEMHEQSRKEARDVAKACLVAALSVPPGDQAPQTLGGMIAAIYGELDAEDCNKIDRAWIEWRGRGTITYALASEVKKP